MVIISVKPWYKIAFNIVLMLINITSMNLNLLLQKSNAGQIYPYNFDNFNYNQSLYYDPNLADEENKCLNGLLNRLPQKGDKETTEACLNTFGYNPEQKIKSPIMIIFEIGKTSQEVTTTILYKSKNAQINQKRFMLLGHVIMNGIHQQEYIRWTIFIAITLLILNQATAIFILLKVRKIKMVIL